MSKTKSARTPSAPAFCLQRQPYLMKCTQHARLIERWTALDTARTNVNTARQEVGRLRGTLCTDDQNIKKRGRIDSASVPADRAARRASFQVARARLALQVRSTRNAWELLRDEAKNCGDTNPLERATAQMNVARVVQFLLKVQEELDGHDAYIDTLPSHADAILRQLTESETTFLLAIRDEAAPLLNAVTDSLPVLGMFVESTNPGETPALASIGGHHRDLAAAYRAFVENSDRISRYIQDGSKPGLPEDVEEQCAYEINRIRYENALADLKTAFEHAMAFRGIYKKQAAEWHTHLYLSARTRTRLELAEAEPQLDAMKHNIAVLNTLLLRVKLALHRQATRPALPCGVEAIRGQYDAAVALLFGELSQGR